MIAKKKRRASRVRVACRSPQTLEEIMSSFRASMIKELWRRWFGVTPKPPAPARCGCKNPACFHAPGLADPHIHVELDPHKRRRIT